MGTSKENSFVQQMDIQNLQRASKMVEGVCEQSSEHKHFLRHDAFSVYPHLLRLFYILWAGVTGKL